MVRGHRVMLDSDLAELYEVETFNLNKAEKRNIERFPDDFMFQLSADEYKNLLFQIGISSSHGGRRNRPATTVIQLANNNRAIYLFTNEFRFFAATKGFSIYACVAEEACVKSGLRFLLLPVTIKNELIVHF